MTADPVVLSLLAATTTAGAAAVALRGMAQSRRPRGRAEGLRTEATESRARRSLVEWIGLTVLERFRRRDRPVTPEEARRVGWVVVVVAVASMPAGPLLGGACGALAAWVPGVLRRRRERDRLNRLAADLPEIVDLLALALGSGLNVPLAIEAVGRRASGGLAEELAGVAADAERGRRLGDALDGLPNRCGESVRPLAALLAAGERYGVPLVESLDRLAIDVRATERRRAEETARRLPVKMLFPLVVCILPAFGLLTLGPMLVTSFPTLSF